MTGAITTNSTFDGVDIATRDAVLTSTTTTANAALPKAGGAMTGAITTNSTFDGRDVATDGTKLDGIEASATADQTKSDIEGLGIELPAANLTGTVAAARLDTATTTAESDDSTKIATTAYVTDKITTLIGGAPSTLNDLNELAAAINDDASYNTTLTTALATKLPKAGGAMTGAITTNSTFDGRDVGTDGTKLDTIETNATADQTAAQIKTHLEDGIDSVHYVDGSIDHVHLAGDIIDGDNIGDNVINSEHYAAGSIDNEHLAANSVDSDNYVDGSIDVAHMAANSIDSAQYVDGSIDGAHIANDVIDSQHYAADSIDEEHIANDAVGSAELKSLATLLIINSAGTTVATYHCAGA